MKGEKALDRVRRRRRVEVFGKKRNNKKGITNMPKIYRIVLYKYKDKHVDRKFNYQKRIFFAKRKTSAKEDNDTNSNKQK